MFLVEGENKKRDAAFPLWESPPPKRTAEIIVENITKGASEDAPFMIGRMVYSSSFFLLFAMA